MFISYILKETLRMQKIKNIIVIMLFLAVIFSIFQAVNATTVDQMLQQARDSFNSKFTSYTGTQSAGSVRALMTQIRTSNTNNPDHQVAVKGSIGTSPEEVELKVNAQKQYTVELEYGQDWYVTAVVVEEYVNIEYNQNNTTTNNNTNTNTNLIEITNQTNQNKDGPVDEKLPETGKETTIILITIVLVVLAISYFKYKGLDKII